MRRSPRPTLFPYTTLFRSLDRQLERAERVARRLILARDDERAQAAPRAQGRAAQPGEVRSEEHTSELQSHVNLVCRLLLEKKTPAARISLGAYSLFRTFTA